jgi:DNA-binding transcriptional LysR family regulator
LTVNSIDASIAAAEAGIGIARPLSYQAQASVLAGRLTPILQHFAPPPVPVNAIYPARRIASANIAAFVKTARAYFKAHPLVPVEAWRRGAARKPIAK